MSTAPPPREAPPDCAKWWKIIPPTLCKSPSLRACSFLDVMMSGFPSMLTVAGQQSQLDPNTRQRTYPFCNNCRACLSADAASTYQGKTNNPDTLRSLRQISTTNRNGPPEGAAFQADVPKYANRWPSSSITRSRPLTEPCRQWEPWSEAPVARIKDLRARVRSAAVLGSVVRELPGAKRRGWSGRGRGGLGLPARVSDPWTVLGG